MPERLNVIITCKVKMTGYLVVVISVYIIIVDQLEVKAFAGTAIWVKICMCGIFFSPRARLTEILQSHVLICHRE